MELPVFRDGERMRMCPLDIEKASSWQRWRAKNMLLKRFSLAKSRCSCFICLSKQQLYECENNFSKKLFFLSDVFLCYLSITHSLINFLAIYSFGFLPVIVAI